MKFEIKAHTAFNDPQSSHSNGPYEQVVWLYSKVEVQPTTKEGFVSSRVSFIPKNMRVGIHKPVFATRLWKYILGYAVFLGKLPLHVSSKFCSHEEGWVSHIPMSTWEWKLFSTINTYSYYILLYFFFTCLIFLQLHNIPENAKLYRETNTS